MMISRSFSFDAAHCLPNHPGKCRHLHGHTYEVCVMVDGAINGGTGMVADYGTLKEMMAPLLHVFDHAYLNWYFALPTAELLNLFIANLLLPVADHPNVNSLQVRVMETTHTAAIWLSGEEKDMEAARDYRWWPPTPKEFCDVKAFGYLEPSMEKVASELLAREELLRGAIADVLAKINVLVGEIRS